MAPRGADPRGHRSILRATTYRQRAFRLVGEALLAEIEQVDAGLATRLGRWGQAPCSQLPAPEQVCPACMAPANGQAVVIPATCSQHPGAVGVIGLVVRGLGDGGIELEYHPLGRCALILDATLLFDVLGEWLGVSRPLSTSWRDRRSA